MTTPTFITIAQEHWTSNQSLQFATTVRTRDDYGRRLRVMIRRNAYDHQSSATVELWTPTGWTNVLTHHDITTLRIGKHSYTTRSEAWKADAQADALNLLAAAAVIVA